MLPQSHVAYTWGALNLLQRRFPRLRKVDYRLVAVAAVLPDVIDKPLAWAYFYRRYHTAVLFAHTLLAHLAVLVATSRRFQRARPYAWAYFGHAIIDRLWFFPDTFFWPFRGWRFHEWQKAGSEYTDIRRAYITTFTKRRELWGWEAGGLLIFLWLILGNRLYRPLRLWAFLRSGRLPARRDQICDG